MKAFAINSLPADTTLPTTAITAPSYYNNLSSPQAVGTASDASGIKRVTVRLRRIEDWGGTGNYQWWDGSSWGGSPTEFLATGTTSWTWNTPYLSDGKYALKSTATDTQGNGDPGIVDSFQKYFLVDTTPPTVNLTSPANGSSFTTFPSVRAPLAITAM